MHTIDTSPARLAAMADAIRTLTPVLIALSEKHGVHIARLVLEAALEEYRSQDARRRDSRRPELAIARGREPG